MRWLDAEEVQGRSRGHHGNPLSRHAVPAVGLYFAFESVECQYVAVMCLRHGKTCVDALRRSRM